MKEGKIMGRKKTSDNIRYLILAAILSAMVYVLTAFVKIPTHQGYIHVGDGIIYLAAALLPMPCAMLTGAVGAGLSDYLSGYPMWILPTVIIKALSVIAFSSARRTVITKRNLMALFPATLICIGGYYLAAVALYGDWGAALIDIPTNGIQTLASAALFVFLGFSLDRMSFKKRFLSVRKSETKT